MQREIILAVDDSANSRFAVAYAARLASVVPSLKFVVFHVQPAISTFLVDEAHKDARQRNELKRVFERNRRVAEALLEGYKQEMVAVGVETTNISTATLPRNRDAANDILVFAEGGQYDAIVVGRRGISGLQEAFMGSISNNVIQNSRALPVWVVGGDTTPRNILAAVDGSENSLRAIEHLAFMLEGVGQARITLFHVQPRLQDFLEIDFEAGKAESLDALIEAGNRRCLEAFYPRALKMFAQFHIAEAQISTKTVKGFTTPGRAILKELRGGVYDTVVMGRRGMNKSFFTGSVSNYIINKIDDRSVWIVP